MVTIVAMSFMACGGDDDEPGTSNEVIDPGVKPATNFTYFVPFTDWNGTLENVETYMLKTGMTLNDSNINGSSWEMSSPNIHVYYTIGMDGKLRSAEVDYFWYNAQDFRYILAQTQKLYNVTLTKIASNDSNDIWNIRAVPGGGDGQIAVEGYSGTNGTMMRVSIVKF